MLSNFKPSDWVDRFKELRQPRLGPDGMPDMDRPWYRTPMPVAAVVGAATLAIGGIIAVPKIVDSGGGPSDDQVVAAAVAPERREPIEAPVPGGEPVGSPGDDVDVSDLVSGRDAPPPAEVRQVGSSILGGGPEALPPAPEAPEDGDVPPPPPASEEAPPAPEPEPEPAPPEPTRPSGGWNLTRETPAAPPPPEPVDVQAPPPAPEPAPEPVELEPAPEPPAPEPAPAEPEPEPEPAPEPAPEPEPEPAQPEPEPEPVEPTPPTQETTTVTATETATAAPSSTPRTTSTERPEPTTSTEVPDSGPVTYRVDGSGRAKVTYIGQGGNPVTETVTLPWTKTVHRGLNPSDARVTAQASDGGDVDTAIEYGNQVVQDRGESGRPSTSRTSTATETSQPSTSARTSEATSGPAPRTSADASDSYGTS